MSTRLCFLCFRFDALTELAAFMRTEFLCISVLRVESGPRVKLASCKSALTPPVVCSTDRSKAVVPVLVLLFVAFWFILQGDLLYVFPCVILFLCFTVLLVLPFTRLGKRECFSYVCSVCACLDLSVSSSSWALGRAAVCDCGTPWTFLLPVLVLEDFHGPSDTGHLSPSTRNKSPGSWISHRSSGTTHRAPVFRRYKIQLVTVFSEKTDVQSLPHCEFSVLLLWPWKLDQGHQNPVSSLVCPSYTAMKNTKNPTTGHKILCRQKSVTPTPTTTGSTP